MTANPTGPQPDHQARLTGFEAGEPDGVLAHGQRFGQGGQVGGQGVGHREQEDLLEGHVLGQPAGVVVGVADLLDARGPQNRWAPSRPGCPPEASPPVSGPCSTISAQNSWPKTQSAAGSSAGTPTDSINPVKWEKSASACRSEPQMPAASDRTTTWPEPGVTSATSATTSWPALVTAARISAPPFLGRTRPDGRWSLRTCVTKFHIREPMRGGGGDAAVGRWRPGLLRRLRAVWTATFRRPVRRPGAPPRTSRRSRDGSAPCAGCPAGSRRPPGCRWP